MPYATIDELPDTFNNLPDPAKRQAMEVVNSSLAAGDDEETAIRKAWGAVKRSWHQSGEQWVKNAEAELETEDVEGVELFAVGTWNGDPYTQEDLDAMVEAYGAGIPQSRPVKLGHIKDGKPVLLEPGFAAPAVGWVENLRREGDKLFGDLRAVPKTLAKLVRAGAYRHRSSEIYWNFTDHTGKVWPRVFKALALLGDKMPAVQTLADVAALYQYEEEPGEVRSYETDLDPIAELEAAQNIIQRLIAKSQWIYTSSHQRGASRPSREVSEAAGGTEFAEETAGQDPDEEAISEQYQMDDADVLLQLDVLVDRMEALIRNRAGAPRLRMWVNEVRRGLEAMTKKQEEGDDVSDAIKEAVYEVLELDEGVEEEEAIGKLREFVKGETLEALEPIVDATKYLDRESEEYQELAAKAERAEAAEQALYEKDREALLDAALEDGRILPAELEAWRGRYDAQKEWTVEVLGSLPKKVDFSEHGKGSTTVAGEKALVEAIHKYMDENSVDYETAYDAVKGNFNLED